MKQTNDQTDKQPNNFTGLFCWNNSPDGMCIVACNRYVNGHDCVVDSIINNNTDTHRQMKTRTLFSSTHISCSQTVSHEIDDENDPFRQTNTHHFTPLPHELVGNLLAYDKITTFICHSYWCDTADGSSFSRRRFNDNSKRNVIVRPMA